MAMNSYEWVNLLTVDLRRVFDETTSKFKSMIPMVMGSDTTNKHQETDLGFSGIGDFQKFTGVINTDSMTEEYDKTIKFPTWANGFEIHEDTYEDSGGLGGNRRIFDNKSSNLSLSYQRTKEKHAAEIFNHAFDANNMYASGDLAKLGDGKALCANDHTSKADANYVGDNYKTTAFSASEVEADRRAMRNITDGKGNKLDMELNTLLVPLALEEQAFELINSTGKVDTADNNKNFHNGKYNLAVWSYLTSDDNWFSLDIEMWKMACNFITRKALMTDSHFDKKTKIYTFLASARHNIMVSEWRSIIGHKPV